MEHYYVLSHSGKKLGNTVKEARTNLNINGRVLKILFEEGIVKRINSNSQTVNNNDCISKT